MEYRLFRRYILGAWTFIAAGLLVACGDKEKESEKSASNGPSAPLAEYVVADNQGQRYSIIGKGFVRASSQIAVVSELSGVVDEVSPQLVIGGRIAQGDMIFRLEQRTFIAEKKRAQAALTSARATRANAARQVQRLLTLENDNLVSEAQRDQAQVALASAKAAVQQSEAALTLADERLDDTVVRAPFDAQVISESLNQGAFVNPGQEVATIFDISMAEVIVGLAENDADDVMRLIDDHGGSDKITVKISPDISANEKSLSNAGKSGESVLGRIRSISPALDERARTVDFLIEIPEAFEDSTTPKFLLGDYTSVKFPAMASGALYSVPEGVVRQERNVFVIDENDVLQSVEVSVISREKTQVLFTVAQTSSANIDSSPRLLLTSLAEEAEGLSVRPKAAEALQAAELKGAP